MKTYNEKEVKKLRAHVFSANTKKGMVQIKAFLKENAVKAMRAEMQDPSLNENEVSIVPAWNTEQTSVDEVVFVRSSQTPSGKWFDEFEIRLMQ